VAVFTAIYLHFYFFEAHDFNKNSENQFELECRQSKTFGNMIIALLKTRTVCLTDVATALSGRAKTESKYKTLQRFFQSYAMDIDTVSQMVANILPISKEKWTISIDRTNWKLGKANINILCLGICYMGVCFPVVWISLDKRGNSNTGERITLIEKFITFSGRQKSDVSLLIVNLSDTKFHPFNSG